MNARDEIIRTVDGLVSLRGVVDALLRIKGVGSADAVTRTSADGLEVVGVLTVSDETGLTPHEVMETVRANEPRNCWPHRVLLSYERPVLASRAA